LKAGQAYVATPRVQSGASPAVLIVPDHAGLNPYYIGEADRLADMGVVAIAVDFMRGKSAKTEKEVSDLQAKVEASYLEKVVQAGFELMKTRKDIQHAKMAVLGYGSPGQSALKQLKNFPDVNTAIFISVPPVLDAKEIAGVKARFYLLYATQSVDIPRSVVADFEKILNASKATQEVKWVSTDHRRWWDYAMKDNYEIRPGNETRQYILDKVAGLKSGIVVPVTAAPPTSLPAPTEN
jgi:dienelactone hydrolase